MKTTCTMYKHHGAAAAESGPQPPLPHGALAERAAGRAGAGKAAHAPP